MKQWHELRYLFHVLYHRFGDVNIMHQIFVLFGIFTVNICMYVILVSICVYACVYIDV